MHLLGTNVYHCRRSVGQPLCDREKVLPGMRTGLEGVEKGTKRARLPVILSKSKRAVWEKFRFAHYTAWSSCNSP